MVIVRVVLLRGMYHVSHPQPAWNATADVIVVKNKTKKTAAAAAVPNHKPVRLRSYSYTSQHVITSLHTYITNVVLLIICVIVLLPYSM